MTTFRSSGDPAADRRYDYARAAAQAGDHAAAADLCEQALELALRWAPAWFALGEAREALGEAEPADRAFAEALACDAADSLGAALRLARLRGETPAQPPASYVRDLFDQYAPRFEKHLVEALSYTAPAVLRAAIEAARPGSRFTRALDLGCGTGLMARELAGLCDAIDGVDLAPAMAARARASGLYQSVEAGDLVDYLATQAPASADLIVAADVFVYCGDLAPAFAAARRALAPAGLFAFTLQRAEADGFTLGQDLRYAHAPAYVARVAAGSGLAVLACDEVSVRRDRGADVAGLALVLAAP